MMSRSFPGAALAAMLLASCALLAGCASSPTAPTNTPTITPTKTATGTPTKTTTPEGTCSVDQLQVTLGPAQGTAGANVMPLIFKNIGSSDCILKGFPGVSFVGDGNGTQLGAPAKEDDSVDIVSNTIKPGGSVSAQLKIEEPGNYGDKCTIVPADGLRVYPPHSYDAVFVKDSSLKACSNDNVVLMSVQPVLPVQ